MPITNHTTFFSSTASNTTYPSSSVEREWNLWASVAFLFALTCGLDLLFRLCGWCSDRNKKPVAEKKPNSLDLSLATNKTPLLEEGSSYSDEKKPEPIALGSIKLQ